MVHESSESCVQSNEHGAFAPPRELTLCQGWAHHFRGSNKHRTDSHQYRLDTQGRQPSVLGGKWAQAETLHCISTGDVGADSGPSSHLPQENGEQALDVSEEEGSGGIHWM